MCSPNIFTDTYLSLIQKMLLVVFSVTAIVSVTSLPKWTLHQRILITVLTFNCDISLVQFIQKVERSLIKSRYGVGRVVMPNWTRYDINSLIRRSLVVYISNFICYSLAWVRKKIILRFSALASILLSLCVIKEMR